MTAAIVSAAEKYIRAGFSCIPIRGDGSKAPQLTSWKIYQERRPTKAEVVHMFTDAEGIAILGGLVSDSLEVLDFDKPGVFEEWSSLASSMLPGIVDSLPVVVTPDGGRHLYYRCAEIAGSDKLAECVDPYFGADLKKPKHVLIETKAEGGYVVAPPSSANCHVAHLPYELGGTVEIESTPTITPAQRRVFLDCAMSFNEVAVERTTPQQAPVKGATRPGDDFNAAATWPTILEPHGWKLVNTRDGVSRWCRPGKDPRSGLSATTGKIGDNLFVFSTSAAPLEAQRAYSKFSVYGLLNHGGDFYRAARELGRLGYGSTPKKPATPAPPDDPDPPMFKDRPTDVVDDPADVDAEDEKTEYLRAIPFAEMSAYWRNSDRVLTMSTGLKSLDSQLGGGIAVGQLTVLLGYTGIGKSEFVRQIRTRVAKEGNPVLHLDVELGFDQINRRDLAQASGIPSSKIVAGKMNDLQFDAVASAQAEIETLPISTINPGGAVPAADLDFAVRKGIRELREANPGKQCLCVFDSLQRISFGWASVSESRRLQVEACIQWALSIAASEGVAVIGVSEQRRSFDGKIPTEQELLTSGAETRSLEFQSHAVMGLISPPDEEALARADDEEYSRRVLLMVAKTREGRVGVMAEDLIFSAPCWGMSVARGYTKRQIKILDILADGDKGTNELHVQIKGKKTLLIADLEDLEQRKEIRRREVNKRWELL